MKKIIMAIPSFLVASAVALPVLTCPACWPLYAGILSAMGLNFIDYTPYLLPATVVLLIVSLFPLAWKAKQRRGYAPFWGGVGATLFILTGKFYLHLTGLFYTGVILLVVMSIWNLWPQTKNCSACPQKE